MLRLLGILALGHLIFGDHSARHYRRMGRRLRRGLLLGAILGYLSNRDEDERRRKDAREARMEEIRAEIEARRARREQQRKADVIQARPEKADTGRESKEIRDLVDDLERDARTAAMATSVPTIQFPEGDEEAPSSGKYGYA